MIFKKLFNKQPSYRFSDPENTSCIVCEHVLAKERPILHVTHDDDGMWQFLCGAEGHSPENAKVIGLGQAVELDQSINDLYEMPLGVGAERESLNDTWQPFKL